MGSVQGVCASCLKKGGEAGEVSNLLLTCIVSLNYWVMPRKRITSPRSFPPPPGKNENDGTEHGRSGFSVLRTWGII